MQSDSEAAAENCNINRIGSPWRVRMFHRSWFQVTLVRTRRTTREGKTALPHVLHLRQSPNQIECTSASGDTASSAARWGSWGLLVTVEMSARWKNGIAWTIAGRSRDTHGDTGWLS